MMRLLVGLTGLGGVLAAGVALAQAPTPPAGAGAPPVTTGPEVRSEHGMEGHGMEGHGMEGHGWRGVMHGMQGMRREPPSKAARFMFRRGDAVVAIKCADDEPMKACVDAASVLMDKLSAAPK